MKLPRIGRLPRLGASPLVSQWLMLMLTCSVVSWFDNGWLESRFALIPSRVWLGDIWRLGTWIFLEPAPVVLVLATLAVFKLGSDLAGEWRDAALQRLAMHVVIGAGAITTLFATLADDPRIVRIGALAVIDFLAIAWARQFPGPWRHRLLAAAGGLTTVLVLTVGPVRALPELAACAIAALHPLPRRR